MHVLQTTADSTNIKKEQAIKNNVDGHTILSCGKLMFLRQVLIDHFP